MGKLIDADDLIKRIAQIHGNLNTKNVGQAIDDMPDATPRQRFLIDEDGKITPLSEPKKGHWDMVRRDRWIYAKCTKCGSVSNVRTPYCGYCGARMEKEDAEIH